MEPAVALMVNADMPQLSVVKAAAPTVMPRRSADNMRPPIRKNVLSMSVAPSMASVAQQMISANGKDATPSTEAAVTRHVRHVLLLAIRSENATSVTTNLGPARANARQSSPRTSTYKVSPI